MRDPDFHQTVFDKTTDGIALRRPNRLTVLGWDA